MKSFGFLNFKTTFLSWEVLSDMLWDMAVAKQMEINKLPSRTTFSVCNEQFIEFLGWNFLVQALTPVLNRAMRYYKERRIWWANLVRQVMRLDFSWDAAPVDQYIRLYEEAVTSGVNTAGRWRRNYNWVQFSTEGIDYKSHRHHSCWCTCNIVELAWLQSPPSRTMQFYTKADHICMHFICYITHRGPESYDENQAGCLGTES